MPVNRPIPVRFTAPCCDSCEQYHPAPHGETWQCTKPGTWCAVLQLSRGFF